MSEEFNINIINDEKDKDKDKDREDYYKKVLEELKSKVKQIKVCEIQHICKLYKTQLCGNLTICSEYNIR